MRKIVLTILLILIIILSAFYYKYTTRITYIDESEAKEIVLKDLDIEEAEITFNSIEYKETNDTYIYVLEFNDSKYTYIYRVNAKTKKIIYSKKEEIVYSDYISESKVKEVVCTYANLNNDECIISSIEFIDSEATPTYEVIFYYNNIKYTYTVNAYTGSIISIVHIKSN